MEAKQFIPTWPLWRQFDDSMMTSTIQTVIDSAHQAGMLQAAQIASAYDLEHGDETVDRIAREIARKITKESRKA